MGVSAVYRRRKMGVVTGEGDGGMLELWGWAYLLVRRDRRCLCTCQPLRVNRDRGEVGLTAELSVRHTGRGLISVWNEPTYQLHTLHT